MVQRWVHMHVLFPQEAGVVPTKCIALSIDVLPELLGPMSTAMRGRVISKVKLLWDS